MQVGYVDAPFNKYLEFFKGVAKNPEAASRIHLFLDQNRQAYFKQMQDRNIDYLSCSYENVSFIVRKKNGSVRYYITAEKPLGKGRFKVVDEHFKYPKGTNLAFGSPRSDQKAKSQNEIAGSMEAEYALLTELNKTTNCVLKAKFFAKIKSEEITSESEPISSDTCASVPSGATAPVLTESYIFATEKCDGTLLELLQKPLSSEQRLLVVKHIITAYRDLHAAGYVHRDIKLENIFYIQGLDGNITIKIADLGLACKKDLQDGTIAGNGLHFSPEICKRALQGNFNVRDLDLPKADAWAVGLICYKVYMGAYPPLVERGKKGMNSRTYIEEVSRIEIIADLNPEHPIESLLAGLVDVNPDTRFSMETACHMIQHL